ncbi:hypothetical protein TTHERM_00188550 (macronuclear) [Tetrahymena thermophila SB210]|uniref:Uncharacterized protein n=1 Tax=Tetrahymena thermophila (strain SB210) TaxID=312017 RepID=I7LUY1_TETTS|nr:hypothetical protein TTHERM_00188550 [Tetrahymena thermophila SB210]EAR96286.2 hypothetical protein TTHERM_00188550 [Tetrahymena thermophila SB210]|eukprot:XP_001016531.2 hypothetical protein TTHERM_00188550 [Tetrahymena thermophila SB210]
MTNSKDKLLKILKQVKMKIVIFINGKMNKNAIYRKLRKTENEDTNILVFQFYIKACSFDLPISGPILKEAALSMAKKIRLQVEIQNHQTIQALLTSLKNSLIFTNITKQETYSIEMKPNCFIKSCQNEHQLKNTNLLRVKIIAKRDLLFYLLMKPIIQIRVQQSIMQCHNQTLNYLLSNQKIKLRFFYFKYHLKNQTGQSIYMSTKIFLLPQLLLHLLKKIQINLLIFNYSFEYYQMKYTQKLRYLQSLFQIKTSYDLQIKCL